MSVMTTATRETTTYEWVRAYTALSRSGCLNDAIRACEEAWGADVLGNAAAAEAVQRVPGYEAYANALQTILTFPLTVYRVTTADAWNDWKEGKFRRPVAATLSADLPHLVREAFFTTEQHVLLLKGIVSDPTAVIMRGRIEAYELVIDSGRVRPVEVTVLPEPV
jgi:hypothetical protein